jgi:hypothetical protein
MARFYPDYAWLAGRPACRRQTALCPLQQAWLVIEWNPSPGTEGRSAVDAGVLRQGRGRRDVAKVGQELRRFPAAKSAGARGFGRHLNLHKLLAIAGNL